MTVCKKDDRQKTEMSKIFIAIKVVGLPSNIWPSRKALKGCIKILFMILDLLYHKGKFHYYSCCWW